MPKPKMTVTLKCSCCGKESKPMTGNPVGFSFDLIPYAKKADFLWRNDSERSRALIFCSAQCEEAAKNKRGGFLKYPAHGAKKIAA